METVAEGVVNGGWFMVSAVTDGRRAPEVESARRARVGGAARRVVDGRKLLMGTGIEEWCETSADLSITAAATGADA
jgi:hypothetical protein